MMNERMMNEDDRDRDRLMDDEAVEDAVLSYLEASPELMQGIAPERDLWSGIESRITARVLPLGDAVLPQLSAVGTETRANRNRRLRWTSWLPMAAAAAVLISATSSVTYVLTRRGDAQSRAAIATASASIRASGQHAATAQVPVQTEQATEQATEQVTAAPREMAVSSPQHGQYDVDHGTTRTHSVPSHGSTAHGSTATSTQLVSSTDDASDASPRATYDEEIMTLRSALDARRAQLDPATVRTIEQNLSVIDNAIAQSRAALARDPKSQFLGSQLDRSLAKKTDLLRAAALLPSA